MQITPQGCQIIKEHKKENSTPCNALCNGIWLFQELHSWQKLRLLEIILILAAYPSFQKQQKVFGETARRPYDEVGPQMPRGHRSKHTIEGLIFSLHTLLPLIPTPKWHPPAHNFTFKLNSLWFLSFPFCHSPKKKLEETPLRTTLQTLLRSPQLYQNLCEPPAQNGATHRSAACPRRS